MPFILTFHALYIASEQSQARYFFSLLIMSNHGVFAYYFPSIAFISVMRADNLITAAEMEACIK